MQVHGIFTMVEFLVVHQKLSAFVEYLALSRTLGVDVFHRLSYEVVRITGLDRTPFMKTVAQLYLTLLRSLGGRHKRSFYITIILLECVFEARAEFSRAYSRIPGFGWPLVLLKMWPRLQITGHEAKDRYEKIEELGQLRDLANRCLLVASPYERCVAQTLTEIDCLGNELFVEDPFEEPKDFRDLEGVTCTLVRHLSTRPTENVLGGLKHLSTMSEYILQLTRLVEHYALHPPIIQVAFNRLWDELTSNPSDKYPLEDVVGYGAELLRQTLYVWQSFELKKHSNGTTLLQ